MSVNNSFLIENFCSGNSLLDLQFRLIDNMGEYVNLTQYNWELL